MKNILVLGAGRIGSIAAELLAACGSYSVTLADRASPGTAGRQCPRLPTQLLDVDDEDALDRCLVGCDAVINALPHHLTMRAAEAARRAGLHYLDLTEDVASTKRVIELATDAPRAFVPQCGLAPGFVSIVANDIARSFDALDSVLLRVGALPRYPSNALSYNLTWSTDGLINEYCEPCEAIVEGELRKVPAMGEREEIALDGIVYEAFNTSGGLGTLAETLAGRVRTLNYRSIRYPGHAAVMRLLLDDLRLRERRAVLKDIFEQAIPTTLQDVVVVVVTVIGWRGGALSQQTFARRIYGGEIDGGHAVSAIQLTTASAVCAVLDLLIEGVIRPCGLTRQEDIPLPAFLANRFGRVFDQEMSADDAGGRWTGLSCPS